MRAPYENPGEHVAAELVGAERMTRGRRTSAQRDVLRQRIVGRDERREDASTRIATITPAPTTAPGARLNRRQTSRPKLRAGGPSSTAASRSVDGGPAITGPVFGTPMCNAWRCGARRIAARIGPCLLSKGYALDARNRPAL